MLLLTANQPISADCCGPCFRNNKRKQKKIPQGECLNERGIIPHCFKNAHRDNVNHRQGELKISLGLIFYR
jgi:hypothetical protein